MSEYTFRSNRRRQERTIKDVLESEHRLYAAVERVRRLAEMMGQAGDAPTRAMAAAIYNALDGERDE